MGNNLRIVLRIKVLRNLAEEGITVKEDSHNRDQQGHIFRQMGIKGNKTISELTDSSPIKKTLKSSMMTSPRLTYNKTGCCTSPKIQGTNYFFKCTVI